jgi:hypothetical protein
MRFAIRNFAGLSKLAITLYLCVPFPSHAAEFSKSASSNGGPDIIFIVGDLRHGDEARFINVAINSGNAIVFFQSPGGNLLAGIEIGKAIRLKGFATFVPGRVQCASACALAWLGGRVRYMSNTARVGFHAAYVDAGGQPAVSSAGNALVGAYLNQLGLPAAAIIFITAAPPEGIQWLNFSDSQRYGIDVREFDLPLQSTAAPSSPVNESFSSQTRSVKKELYEYVGATNKSNELALVYLEGKYPNEVNYYGKIISKGAVLSDKRAFFKKWPIRNYSIQPDSVTVACNTASECKSEGTLDWEASGSILNSKGSATFTFLWALENNVWKIKSESSHPIDRRISRPSQNQ